MKKDAIVIDAENMRIDWCDRSDISICPIVAYLVGKYGIAVIDSKHLETKEDTLTQTFYFTFSFSNNLDFEDFNKFLEFYGYGNDPQIWRIKNEN